MIVNGVIISKDKNKYQIGQGLKLVKKGSGLTSTKGSSLSNVKKKQKDQDYEFYNKKIIFYYNI